MFCSNSLWTIFFIMFLPPALSPMTGASGGQRPQIQDKKSETISFRRSTDLKIKNVDKHLRTCRIVAPFPVLQNNPALKCNRN